ncbi:putative Ig domain-containing protein, partial [Planctomycetota bacterium]|nr:putative Ig domain-containing protein [Planctomycetota bacterium]
MPLPAYTSTYSSTSQARGLHFVAPKDFTITGLRVPMTTTGSQYIQVMRFTGSPNGTNHTTLAYVNGTAAGIINTVNIQVTTGDVIGILGVGNPSGTTQHNYYASGGYSSNIDGSPMTLYRLTHQGNITSAQAGSCLNGGTSSLARVEMYYTVGLDVTTPAILPTAVTGSLYDEVIEADYGTTPYSWQVLSSTPALPSSLALSVTAGFDYRILGTPQTGDVGTYNFTVEVRDAASPQAIKTKAMTLVIEGVQITTANPLPDGVLGTAYSQTIVAANGPTPYTWSMPTGTLPTGLSFAKVGENYRLSGTPVGSGGLFQFQVRVTDNTTPTPTTKTKDFELYIGWPASAITYSLGQPTTGMGTSTSTTHWQWGYRFRCNSGGISVVELGRMVPPLVATTPKTMTLFNATTRAKLAQVTVPAGPAATWAWGRLSAAVPLVRGEEYIVCVYTENGYYYANNSSNSAWYPTGDIEYRGRQYYGGTAASPDTFPTTTGTASQRYQYGVCDIGIIREVTVVSDFTMPAAGEGVAYDELIKAAHGATPYTWTHYPGSPPLPTGLSLVQLGNDFRLSGTPPYGSAGIYTFDVEVEDDNNVSERVTMTLAIEALKITNANPVPDGQEGMAYTTQVFTAENGPTPHVWSVVASNLPTGMSLGAGTAANTYELSGTPAAGTAGFYTFELHVRDGRSTVATKKFDLYIDWASGALTYPLGAQAPTAFHTTTTTNYLYGWRFKCNTGGIDVIRLGSNFPTALATVPRTITLWEVGNTSSYLAQVTVSSGSGWQWRDLTAPYRLVQGTDYNVVVHSTNGFYYDSPAPASWFPTGDIQHLGRCYQSSSSPSTYPGGFNSAVTYMYGLC